MRVFRNSSAIAGMIFAALMLSAVPVGAQTTTSPKALAFGIAQEGECSGAVAKAWDNIGLRVNNGGTQQYSQESAKAHLSAAEVAAAAGREQECWRQLGWSKYLVR